MTIAPIDINTALASVTQDGVKDLTNIIFTEVESIRITWLGYRMIQFKGFTGEVEICSIIKKFLESASKPDYLQLKVQTLCHRCDIELEKCFVYGGMLESAQEIFRVLRLQSEGKCFLVE